MGIDSIGKPKAPVAGLPNASSSVSDVSGTSTFEVRTNKTEGVTATSDVDELQAGKISVDDYLDRKVAAATQHLDGKVAAEKLQWIRETLRTQLQQDPMLKEMVRRVNQGVATTTDGSRK